MIVGAPWHKQFKLSHKDQIRKSNSFKFSNWPRKYKSVNWTDKEMSKTRRPQIKIPSSRALITRTPTNSSPFP